MKHAAFQVGCIITTTGYSTTDFDIWPPLSRTILVVLRCIGACAVSTGGGMKVSRVLVLVKTVKKELDSFVHPRLVKKIHLEGRPIEHETLRSINVFTISYLVIFAASVLVIALGLYGPLFEKAMSNVIEVKARGASVLALTTENRREDLASRVDGILTIPETELPLLPLLGVVPLQLFAYYVALQRGCDIDKPRNLAKSVTVE